MQICSYPPTLYLWHKKYTTIFDGKHEQQQTNKKCNLGGGMETADC